MGGLWFQGVIRREIGAGLVGVGSRTIPIRTAFGYVAVQEQAALSAWAAPNVGLSASTV